MMPYAQQGVIDIFNECLELPVCVFTPQTTPTPASCRSCCAGGLGTACEEGTDDRVSSHGMTGGISCCKTTARSCAPGTACRTVYKAWPADIPAFQGFYSPSAAPFRVPPAGA